MIPFRPEKWNNLFIEQGPYRPPSEAYSLLVRVTRNCPWNRCEFCPAYKGEKFAIRPVEEIKQDIQTIKEISEEIKKISWSQGYGGEVSGTVVNIVSNPPFPESFLAVSFWLYQGGEAVFLQDADSLIMKTGDLVEVITFLKERLSEIKRITSYARARTVLKKDIEDLKLIHQAGLSRLHIGLESGYDPLLSSMKKGITAKGHIEAGKRVKESGISLSEYVLLGLGGEEMSREHARKTADVLNRIDPDYIRVRTLMVRKNTPLYHKMKKGDFIPLSEDAIIEEERELIDNLEVIGSHFVSDHARNLLGELEGDFPGDKKKMLATIDRYRDLLPDEKLNFRLGRRANIYQRLDDLSNPYLFKQVEGIISRINSGDPEGVERVISRLMEGFN